MKKNFFILCIVSVALCFLGCNAKDPITSTTSKDPNAVDLGLPSGNLWKNVDESSVAGLSFENVEQYQKDGWSVPTKSDFEELLSTCLFEPGSNGARVVGPNGNSIVLKNGRYLSSTIYDYDSYLVYCLWIGSSSGIENAHYSFYSYNIRLVKHVK